MQQGLSTKVDLSISCNNLINKDTLSLSDPACTVKMFNKSSNKWIQIGITERIKNNLNPKFTKTIPCEYRFEEEQNLLIEVWDVDVTPQKPWIGKIDRDDDLLGTLHCTLGEICGQRGQILKKLLTLPSNSRSKKKSSITIRADQTTSGINETLVIRFEGIKLKKMDLFGKSDPYYIIKKKRQDGTYAVVHKSEIIKNTLNPVWKEAHIHLGKLLNSNNKKEEFLFECFDWDRNSSDDMIGSCKMSVDGLMKKQKYKLEYKKKSKRGEITARTVKCLKNYTFFDFLEGGMEMNLLVAVDFTGSNGNPNQPGTLHYHSQGQMNEYEGAIQSIGSILSNYDSDKKFPAYGFGAMMPQTRKVAHCFALNGNPQQPECIGVQGLLQAYHQALTNVQLYGPTHFNEVIKAAAAFAKSEYVCQDVQKYFVLLILTDGIINDMDLTIKEIVEASHLPLSIVIVGVGNANFQAMDFLDCDDGLLTTKSGQQALRDIVQFVPYSKFKNYGYQYLAKATLAEIPGQVVDFFKKKKIIPNKRPQVNPQMMMNQQQPVLQQPPQSQPQNPQMMQNQPQQQGGVIGQTFNV